MGLISNDKCSYKKQDKQRKRPCEDKSRDGNNGATNQENIWSHRTLGGNEEVLTEFAEGVHP